ncbi:MAG: A24 family peptidase [Betaproteobacteria bacterium]|nr:A24 family peptidase [Betaproteobacteria bacterium]
MDNFLQILQDHPTFIYVLFGITGLIVGSFLNVVIFRLPKMLHTSWQRQCAELNGEELLIEVPFNLATPASTCPQCARPVRTLENIPVISYMLLRGRCAGCAGHISLRYPIIELLSSALSVSAALLLTDHAQALVALPFIWAMIALTFIDLDTQLLPDAITLPLLWLGLLLNLNGTFVPLSTAVGGAMAGYLSLWSVYWLFKLITGKEGMGHGDFKLLAAIGAWLGWSILPLVILLSSAVGAITGLLLIVVGGHRRSIPIPFGPYLAGGALIALIWGKPLSIWLFHLTT